MQVVTAREFRSNQTNILSAAKRGESVMITSRIGNFKIVPISSDDEIVKKDIIASLEEVQSHIDGQINLPNARDVIL